MLKLITAGAFADLVRRAETAETALADANRRLENVAVQQESAPERERGDEAAELRAELADARLRLCQRNAELRLGELVLAEAKARLVDRDREVAELRAELQRPAAGCPADPELPEHTVLTCRTVGGGLVAVIARPDESFTDGRCDYGYQCLACGDSNSGAYQPGDGRRWANEHAGMCRAVPTGGRRQRLT
ncbi:hypothetical protein ACFV1L_21010 [Kitasatospora sp. NPDC059646]|uniref:hypothetical protein n=1 Tax=Kitasatospora sp. NPDC059646 TaxID=3346893 RepID=UPI0036A3F163